MKNRLCHWGPITALSIITYLFSTSTLAIMMYCPPTNTLEIIHSIVFMLWVINIFSNFFKALFLGPGYVPFKWKPEKEEDCDYLQYCQSCKGYKAPRAHHCKACSRCILKMDHHCPWINNCVGHTNHKSFVLFLMFVVIGCSHATMVMFLCVLDHLIWVKGNIMVRVNPRSFIRLNHYILILLLFGIGLSIGVTIAVGILLYYQIKSVIYNETGIESWIIEKAKSRRHGTDDQFVFPYDLGIYKNLKQVFSWSCDYVGDGINWEVFPGCGIYDLTIEQIEQKCIKRDNMVSFKVVDDYNGSYTPLKYGYCTFFKSPWCDENRLPVRKDDIINATRYRKYWIYGEKQVMHDKLANGDSLPLGESKDMKGWIPRRCLQQFPDDVAIFGKEKVT